MLSQAQCRQFREDGFLVLARLVAGDALARHLAVLDELVARGCALAAPTPHFALELNPDGSHRPGLLHKVQGVCVVEPRVLELAREPAIVDLGPRALLRHLPAGRR